MIVPLFWRCLQRSTGSHRAYGKRQKAWHLDVLTDVSRSPPRKNHYSSNPSPSQLYFIFIITSSHVNLIKQNIMRSTLHLPLPSLTAHLLLRSDSTQLHSSLPLECWWNSPRILQRQWLPPRLFRLRPQFQVLVLPSFRSHWALACLH